MNFKHILKVYVMYKIYFKDGGSRQFRAFSNEEALKISQHFSDVERIVKISTSIIK